MSCKYCKTYLVPKDVDSIVLNGFLDNDNKVICCFNCKTIHYEEKNKTEFAGKYSEIPLTIPQSNHLID